MAVLIAIRAENDTPLLCFRLVVADLSNARVCLDGVGRPVAADRGGWPRLLGVGRLLILENERHASLMKEDGTAGSRLDDRQALV